MGNRLPTLQGSAQYRGLLRFDFRCAHDRGVILDVRTENPAAPVRRVAAIIREVQLLDAGRCPCPADYRLRMLWLMDIGSSTKCDP